MIVSAVKAEASAPARQTNRRNLIEILLVLSNGSWTAAAGKASEVPNIRSIVIVVHRNSARSGRNSQNSASAEDTPCTLAIAGTGTYTSIVTEAYGLFKIV